MCVHAPLYSHITAMSVADARETGSSHGSASHPGIAGTNDQLGVGSGLMDAPSLTGPTRQPPTSAEIDAVIAAAIANAPPAPPPMELGIECESAVDTVSANRQRPRGL